MTIKEKFFFFGFGQTAKYFITNLIQSKKYLPLVLQIQKKQV